MVASSARSPNWQPLTPSGSVHYWQLVAAEPDDGRTSNRQPHAGSRPTTIRIQRTHALSPRPPRRGHQPEGRQLQTQRPRPGPHPRPGTRRIDQSTERGVKIQMPPGGQDSVAVDKRAYPGWVTAKDIFSSLSPIWARSMPPVPRAARAACRGPAGEPAGTETAEVCRHRRERPSDVSERADELPAEGFGR